MKTFQLIQVLGLSVLIGALYTVVKLAAIVYNKLRF